VAIDGAGALALTGAGLTPMGAGTIAVAGTTPDMVAGIGVAGGATITLGSVPTAPLAGVGVATVAGAVAAARRFFITDCNGRG
jgi:hypothetical protein